ncbi:hypothetical protein D3C83_105950 [compost metagenome]
MRLLDQSKLTLLDAIHAAEGHKGGYATSADLDGNGPIACFEVEVIRQLRSLDVRVDAVTGAVTQLHDD